MKSEPLNFRLVIKLTQQVEEGVLSTDRVSGIITTLQPLHVIQLHHPDHKSRESAFGHPNPAILQLDEKATI